MNIAIIEDDATFRSLLQVMLDDPKWHVNLFEDATDFGKADATQFDVIISDYNLPTMNGRDLLNAVYSKTSAELFLMSADSTIFSGQDVNSQHITGFIDKGKPNSIIEQLKYVDAKIRINKNIEFEKDRFDSLSNDNSYSLEVKHDVMIVGISSILTLLDKENILQEAKKHNYKGIVFFPSKHSVPSIFLGEIVFFYKKFKSNNGRLVFWNPTKSKDIVSQLKACNLDKLFLIFEDIEEAITYLLNNEVTKNQSCMT